MALAFACSAVALQVRSSLRSFAFSLWVGAFVAFALAYPAFFLTWGGFELKQLLVPLIQIIMFGMGTTLSAKDFGRVLAMPKAVLVGIGLQFSVMPLVGFGLATAFGFQPEVAAGVVLIGSCPGGVASNVMTFISRGNVALSVTMTACSTLVSPLMTPLMMMLLAGRMIKIDFSNMMMSILSMVIVPIVAGLVANEVLRMLRLRGPWLDRLLSLVAMAAICYIIAIITALSRDELLGIGVALAAAAVLHNGIGYVLGYVGGALSGLDESTRRTMAIEVGLQNGGMASGLAVNVLKSSNAALASAIFGPWMNISGSVLASYWRGRPVANHPRNGDGSVFENVSQNDPGTVSTLENVRDV
ncbi:MAG: bile acid:sodium symporter family protein [Pirellulales bacterium]